MCLSADVRPSSCGCLGLASPTSESAAISTRPRVTSMKPTCGSAAVGGATGPSRGALGGGSLTGRLALAYRHGACRKSRSSAGPAIHQVLP